MNRFLVEHGDADEIKAVRNRAWFEDAYRRPQRGGPKPSWVTGRPCEHLTNWPDIGGLAQAGGRALVVGSGYGEDAAWLGEQGFSVTGVDISTFAAAHAQRSTDDVGFVVGDATALPFVAKAFSFIADVYTLQCLEPAERPKVAEAVAEVLRPGGVLLVVATATGRVEALDAPWTLNAYDLGSFVDVGLKERTYEEFVDPVYRHLRRIRASYVMS